MTQEQDALITQLAETHSAHMVQLTFRRVVDEQLAMDIVQETFLTACFRADVLARHVNPAGWLYQTLNYLTRREKVKYDREYVENLSLKMDARCFFGTILSVLRAEGVREGGTGGGKRA